VFNLLPGSGLGFTGSNLLAFGLAPVSVTYIPIPIPLSPIEQPPGVGGYSMRDIQRIPVFDNQYSKLSKDDDEIVEILLTLFEVMR